VRDFEDQFLPDARLFRGGNLKRMAALGHRAAGRVAGRALQEYGARARIDVLVGHGHEESQAPVSRDGYRTFDPARRLDHHGRPPGRAAPAADPAPTENRLRGRIAEDALRRDIDSVPGPLRDGARRFGSQRREAEPSDRERCQTEHRREEPQTATPNTRRCQQTRRRAEDQHGTGEPHQRPRPLGHDPVVPVMDLTGMGPCSPACQGCRRDERRQEHRLPPSRAREQQYDGKRERQAEGQPDRGR